MFNRTIAISLLALTLVGLGATVQGTGEASASPTSISIGVGDVANLKPQFGAPYHPLKDFGCNFAFFPNSAVGITAGHCGGAGDEIYSHNTLVGIVRESVAPSTDNPISASVIDYAVVDLLPNVSVNTDGPVAVTGVEMNPYVGMPVYKYGHGLGNQVVQYGEITAVTDNGIETNIPITFCDSGAGIIVLGTNKVVATASGMTDAGANVGAFLGVSEYGNAVGTRISVILERTGL